MPEVQAPENNSSDPRWIALRVSRINLAITVLGVLLAFPVMWWLRREVPLWVMVMLALLFALSVSWDLWQILHKDRDSVGAFHLFDLDQAASRTAEGAQIATLAKANGMSPKLGIRVKFANTKKHPVSAEREGTVLPKAFVSPWFTAVRYRSPEDPAWRRFWPRVIALWPDSLDAQEFRKIRVMLKWK